MMKQHWLYQPESRRKLRIAGIVVLVFIVIVEIFVPMPAYFPVANFSGFNAVYGFLSGLALVLIARLLVVLLKRGEDYYDR
jgi:hypothetical protein